MALTPQQIAKIKDGPTKEAINILDSAVVAAVVSAPVVGGTPIQDAINAAVTAGYGPMNPCSIQIAPGTYTENLTLKEGIHLVAALAAAEKTYSVYINGQHTFSAVGALAPSVNMVALVGICLRGDGATPTLSFLGGNPQILRFLHGEINAAAGVSFPLFINNTGVGSYVLVQDGNLNTADLVVPAAAISVGKLAMALGQANATPTTNAIVMLGAGATLEISQSYTTGGIMCNGLTTMMNVLMNTSLVPALSGAGNLVAGAVRIVGGGSGVVGPVVVPVDAATIP